MAGVTAELFVSTDEFLKLVDSAPEDMTLECCSLELELGSELP